MKKYLTSFLLVLAAMSTISSCREKSKLPEPVNESIPLIIPEINPQKAYFDFTTSSVSVNTATSRNYTRPVFEFVVNPSQGYTELQTVEVYKSFRRSGSSTLGPRVKQTDLNSFPATISLNSQDALAGLYPNSPTSLNPSPLAVKGATDAAVNRIIRGDAVVFTFEYIMKDGRRIILTPLSTAEGSVGAPTGAQTNSPLAAVATFR